MVNRGYLSTNPAFNLSNFILYCRNANRIPIPQVLAVKRQRGDVYGNNNGMQSL